MAPWWRRKSKRFAPFDRAALPEVEPLTFEESFAEGLLVAEAAGRMALKNRIIVMALRGDEPFDATRAAAAAREVIHELVQELDEVAEWSAAERESANQREGRSAHQHDYHRADAWNLRLRERINAAVAERLTELRGDDAYLAELRRARPPGGVGRDRRRDRRAAGPRVARDRGRRGVRARARRPDARPDARARTRGRRRPAPARDLRRARRLLRRLAGLRSRPAGLRGRAAPGRAGVGDPSWSRRRDQLGDERLDAAPDVVADATHGHEVLARPGPRAPSPRTACPGRSGTRRRSPS